MNFTPNIISLSEAFYENQYLKSKLHIFLNIFIHKVFLIHFPDALIGVLLFGMETNPTNKIQSSHFRVINDVTNPI